MIDIINPEFFLLQVMTDIVSCIFLFPVVYALWGMIHDFLCVSIFVHNHDSWFTMRAHFCSCRYCNDVFDIEMGQFFLYCHIPDSWL